MPALHSRKIYQAQTYYHIYNRGANGQDIFFDKNDYWVFRRYIKEELSKYAGTRISPFCLLSNHFHFLLYQEDANTINHFMKSLAIRYVMYLNKKYRRSGRLFQDRYKAILLETPKDRERIIEYILQNPLNKGILQWRHVGMKI